MGALLVACIDGGRRERKNGLFSSFHIEGRIVCTMYRNEYMLLSKSLIIISL